MTGSLTIDEKTPLVDFFKDKAQALRADKKLVISSKFRVRSPRNKIIEWIFFIFGADSTFSYKRTARKLNEFIAKRSVQVPFEEETHAAFRKDVEKVFGRLLDVTKTDKKIMADASRKGKEWDVVKKIYTDTFANLDKIKNELTDEVKDCQKAHKKAVEELKELEEISQLIGDKITKEEELEKLKNNDPQDGDAIKKAEEELEGIVNQLESLKVPEFQKETENAIRNLADNKDTKEKELSDLRGKDPQDGDAIKKAEEELDEINKQLNELFISPTKKAIVDQQAEVKQAFEKLVSHQGKSASKP